MIYLVQAQQKVSQDETPSSVVCFGGFTFQDLTDLRGIKFFSSDSENLEHVECQLYGRK